MKRKVLALFLALVMVVGLLPTAALAASDAPPFTDVGEDDYYYDTVWYYDAVKYVYEKGWMKGTSDTTFSPDTTMTRGMMVTVLHRMEGTPAADGTAFKDVQAGHYYTDAIAWASANKIVKGYGNGKFGPNDPITREQMATVFYHFAGYKGLNTEANGNLSKFTDNGKISAYAVTPMKWAVGVGLIAGVGHNTLAPQGLATRAQVAMILMRMDQKLDLGSNQCTVTFDSAGGTKIEPIQVERGTLIELPEAPEREGYFFIAWYQKGADDMFDPSDAINKDITLVAHWVNIKETTDTDGDKLTDPLEEYYGTRTDLYDTDGDGLTDYQELDCDIGCDPLNNDTDKDGISDAEEDYDGDTYSNLNEISQGTDPAMKDSDLDGLDDNNEINIYKTNPINEDTDKDGASDGKEVELNTDPLQPNDTFQMTAKAQGTDSVKASVSVNVHGDQVDTLIVSKRTDAVLFPSDIPGTMGSAYDFSIDGEFKTAKISFEFDAAQLNDQSKPTIYYFNEQKQELEALETTIQGNVASASVSHFSTYILIDRTIFEEAIAWQDIFDSGDYTSAEVVFVIDDSGSMSSNDSQYRRLEVVRNLIDRLPTNSKIGVISFANDSTSLTSSLTDNREEVKNMLSEENFYSSGGTYMYGAIQTAYSLFTESSGNIMRTIIVLSDGEAHDSSKYNSVVQTCKQENIQLYTVGLGDDIDNSLMSLAEETSGKFYRSEDAEGLADIYENIGQRIDLSIDSDHDGIPDYYEDNMVMFNHVKINMDKNSSDSDGDGIPDAEEITLIKHNNEDGTKICVVGKLNSNPGNADTDGDGLNDSIDPHVMNWDVCDRDLAMCAALCYENGSKQVREGRFYSKEEIIGKKDVEPGENYYFYGLATISELDNSEIWKSWKVEDYIEDNRLVTLDNFSATTYKNGNNIIIAYRGTNELFEWVDNVLCYGLRNYHSEELQARLYAMKIAKRYPHCKLYITGHSLGGYLAQIGTEQLIRSKRADNLQRTAHFNGIGMAYNPFLAAKKELAMRRLYDFAHDGTMSNHKLISYAIQGDWVHALGKHQGDKIEFEPAACCLRHYQEKYPGGSNDLNFWKALANKGAVYGIYCITFASQDIPRYFVKYKIPDFSDYTWLTHETDSFLEHLQRTRTSFEESPSNGGGGFR